MLNRSHTALLSGKREAIHVGRTADGQVTQLNAPVVHTYVIELYERII